MSTKRWLHENLPPDWDARPLSLAHEISGFLESIKDEGTHIDSGTDGVQGDLWVKVQGVEYFVSVKRSQWQIVQDGKHDA